MNVEELYRWCFIKLINDKLGMNMNNGNCIYSNNINELIKEYPDFYNEFKLDGLIYPNSVVDYDKKELSLIHHNGRGDYVNIPVYYAVLEKSLEITDIIVDEGLAYRSGHYHAGMGQTLYNNFETYWRCISNNKEINPFQCCLIHKLVYEWHPKICAGITGSVYKIYDHDYSEERCTSFSPNYNLGEYFRNRIMVMSTEKKLLDDYIIFYKKNHKRNIINTIIKYQKILHSL